eukprot:364692-Chlamydomonas_euryale.AAC.8
MPGASLAKQPLFATQLHDVPLLPRRPLEALDGLCEGLAALAGCLAGRHVVLDGAGSGDVAAAFERNSSDAVDHCSAMILAVLWLPLSCFSRRLARKAVTTSWPCSASVAPCSALYGYAQPLPRRVKYQ